ncbi:MAG: hypothetical protein NTZ17_11990 [Phycisphaerae bacterium]|jgi:hypothetical protein|nr:hypothetical protein [Phycisphaerae bacterium]
MVRIREHKHKRLTRHAVATVLVCAALPAGMIATIMIVARKKEATP